MSIARDRVVGAVTVTEDEVVAKGGVPELWRKQWIQRQ